MNYILNQLRKNKIIDKEELEEYRYALNVLLLKSIHYFVIFATAFYMNIIIESIIFLYCYSTIRSYVGGVHAQNPLFCLFISLLFIVGLKPIINFSINPILSIITLIILSFYWYINCKKSLSKIKFLIQLIFINIGSIILFSLNQFTYINCIFYGYILNIILFYKYKKIL